LTKCKAITFNYL